MATPNATITLYDTNMVATQRFYRLESSVYLSN